MKNRTPPRKLRKRNRKIETVTGNWIFAGKVGTTGATLTFDSLTDDSIIYFDSQATTVTYPSQAFSGFQVGDTITITGQANENIKKKKKVHVARRRKQNKQTTHTITNISETAMTIGINNLVTATKISETSWSVHHTTGVITI